MLIGIVSDIHDALEPLNAALEHFRTSGVERIVTLGDAFQSMEPGEPGAAVARLLHEAGAVGVWGNHDFGLSYEITEEIRNLADPGLLAFASRLQPHLVVEGCRFSHIEPWKDPHRLHDLWSFDGVPDTSERAQLSFDAVPERITFIGHFHTPLIVGARGLVDWDGVQPIRLEYPDRYLVVIPALVDGCYGMYDTTLSELVTARCDSP